MACSSRGGQVRVKEKKKNRMNQQEERRGGMMKQKRGRGRGRGRGREGRSALTGITVLYCTVLASAYILPPNAANTHTN